MIYRVKRFSTSIPDYTPFINSLGRLKTYDDYDEEDYDSLSEGYDEVFSMEQEDEELSITSLGSETIGCIYSEGSWKNKMTNEPVDIKKELGERIKVARKFLISNRTGDTDLYLKYLEGIEKLVRSLNSVQPKTSNLVVSPKDHPYLRKLKEIEEEYKKHFKTNYSPIRVNPTGRVDFLGVTYFWDGKNWNVVGMYGKITALKEDVKRVWIRRMEEEIETEKKDSKYYLSFFNFSLSDFFRKRKHSNDLKNFVLTKLKTL